jgi:phage baseplate assembly protein W
MNDKNIIGTGWGFPPMFSKGLATVEMSSGSLDINQALHLILSTRIGERVMRYDFGCDIHSLQFENISATMLSDLKHKISDAITLHEPRIILDGVVCSSPNDGVLMIEIIYTIQNTNSRHNYVYPYYLKEATISN